MRLAFPGYGWCPSRAWAESGVPKLELGNENPSKNAKRGAQLKLCPSLILLIYKRVLAREPAVVSDGEKGPGLDPVEGEEGEVGVDDAVDEVHIPFLVDIVVHPDQG